MNTSLTLTPVGTAPTAAIDGNALMEKLRAKATNAVRDAFLDSLSPDEYNAFITQAVDEFINGSFHKRFKLATVEQRIYSKEEWDSAAQTGKIDREWDPKETFRTVYHVTKMVPTGDYDPTTDPNTLPGMIRQIVREQVNTNMIKEIMEAPQMKQQFVHNGDYGGYQLFEGFVTKFMVDNWELIVRKEREATIGNTLQMMLNNLRNGGRGY